MTPLESLSSTDEPWLHFAPTARGDLQRGLEQFGNATGASVRFVEGARMRNYGGLFDELQDKLEFPA